MPFMYTLDLVIFANFAGGQIREFTNLAKIIIIVLRFTKVSKSQISENFKHAKITRSTVPVLKV